MLTVNQEVYLIIDGKPYKKNVFSKTDTANGTYFLIQHETYAILIELVNGQLVPVNNNVLIFTVLGDMLDHIADQLTGE